MSASRVEAVETKPQTAPPRWKTEGDDYKADLTAHPQEIKDLCPIVITTIDCRATKFKDADGNVLTVTSRSKDGVVLTVKVTSRLEKKDGKDTEVTVKDGEERTIKQVKTQGKQGDGKLIADASKLVYRESNDLNKQVEGFVNRRTGHGYQAVDGALDYYLAEL